MGVYAGRAGPARRRRSCRSCQSSQVAPVVPVVPVALVVAGRAGRAGRRQSCQLGPRPGLLCRVNMHQATGALRLSSSVATSTWRRSTPPVRSSAGGLKSSMLQAQGNTDVVVLLASKLLQRGAASRLVERGCPLVRMLSTSRALRALSVLVDPSTS